MCWSSAMEGVKAACATIDTECLSNYKKLMYYSIPVEVFGAIFAAWMLISCRLYYAQKQKKTSASSTDTLPDDSRPLVDKPSRTSASLAKLSSDEGVSRPSSRTSKKTSRGAEYSMSKRRSDSTRSRASSRSRSRQRDREREREREPRREYSTRKSSHRSSSKSRRSSRSRAEQAYGSDSSSESDWEDRDERRRSSGSRRSRRR
ncbi:hypothetical protein BCR35DRAFT_299263 [Leucosporidium creatinivorum]|uniref:Uncharacterized protein n=1 Tax=Leucosporidium creatinivorum TaxID=106004 RepID=A0A1Y2G5C7_9BASI|nr:hypothetical protein BCR35DRAFT_299263 [Leucosporidium creatinivorum]